MNSQTGKWAGDKTPGGYRTAQLAQYTPEQNKLFQNSFSNVSPDSYLAKLAAGDQSTFEQMEAPAQRGFNEQIGSLASRFSGMGMGGRRSSGFQNATTAAASNFSQDLASRRNDLRRQAINDLMGLSNTLLNQRPFDRQLVEKRQQSGGWGDAASGALRGGAAGSALGPYGALAGGLIGGASGYFS